LQKKHALKTFVSGLIQAVHTKTPGSSWFCRGISPSGKRYRPSQLNRFSESCSLY